MAERDTPSRPAFLPLRNSLLCFAVPPALTLLALLLREALSARVGPLPPFVTFYPVVMLTAIACGLYPGLFATLLTTLCADYFALPPYRHWAIEAPADRIALGVFAGMGVVMSVVAGLYHRNRGQERIARERAAERDRLAVTLRSIGDAVIATDEKGLVETMNRVAEELTGVAVPEALGRPVEEIFRVVDAQTRRPAASPVGRVLTLGAPTEPGKRAALVSRDGTLRPIADSAAPIRDARGRVSGVVLVFRDQTEEREADRLLRENEERVRLLLEHLPQLVWTADADGKVDYFSRSWRDYTGQSPGAEDWVLVLHPEDQGRVVELWREAVLEQKDFEVEYRLRRADGEFRWFIRRGFRLPGRDGTRGRWIGTCTDVHDLKTSQQILRQADSLKEDFLFMAAHELRTPLTALRLHAELMHKVLGRDGAEVRMRRHLSSMEVQVDRLEELLRTLLDVSRINSGTFTLELGDVDLSEVVRGVLERFGAEAERAGTELRFQPRQVTGRWDRTRLDQVITNLVSNAIKYGNRRPVDLELDESAGAVHLRVRDHGIGVAPEQREGIFERFKRGDNVRAATGLGLGLWISRKLVEAHGGSLSVESALGEGSTFTLSIPLGPSRGERRDPANGLQ